MKKCRPDSQWFERFWCRSSLKNICKTAHTNRRRKMANRKWWRMIRRFSRTASSERRQSKSGDRRLTETSRLSVWDVLRLCREWPVQKQEVCCWALSNVRSCHSEHLQGHRHKRHPLIRYTFPVGNRYCRTGNTGWPGVIVCAGSGAGRMLNIQRIYRTWDFLSISVNGVKQLYCNHRMLSKLLKIDTW